MSTRTAGTTSTGFASVNEASSYSSLSVRSLQRLISAGKLTAYQVGKRRLIDMAALEALIRSGDTPSPETAP